MRYLDVTLSLIEIRQVIVAAVTINMKTTLPKARLKEATFLIISGRTTFRYLACPLSSDVLAGYFRQPIHRQKLLRRYYKIARRSSREGEFHPNPLTGRVEDWRGTISPFPIPASSNAACGFPALRFPVNFASKVM